MKVTSISYDGFVARGKQTLHAFLLFFGAEALLYPLTGGVGKFLRGGFYQFAGVFVGCVVEETNLLSVAATPFAEQKMNPKSDLLGQREVTIHGLRLQTRGLAATGRKLRQPLREGT